MDQSHSGPMAGRTVLVILSLHSFLIRPKPRRRERLHFHQADHSN
jgi:hypothetical protein